MTKLTYSCNKPHPANIHATGRIEFLSNFTCGYVCLYVYVHECCGSSHGLLFFNREQEAFERNRQKLIFLKTVCLDIERFHETVLAVTLYQRKGENEEE